MYRPKVKHVTLTLSTGVDSAAKDVVFKMCKNKENRKVVAIDC